MRNEVILKVCYLQFLYIIGLVTLTGLSATMGPSELDDLGIINQWCISKKSI